VASTALRAVREVVEVHFPRSERPVWPAHPTSRKPPASCCPLRLSQCPPSWQRLNPCHPPFQRLVLSPVMRRCQTPESIVQVLAFSSSLNFSFRLIPAGLARNLAKVDAHRFHTLA